MAKQKRFQRQRGIISVNERKSLLQAILEGLEQREDEILGALTQDLGKPATEAWLAEVLFVKQELKQVLKYLKHWSRPRSVGHPFFFLPARSEVRREPFGSVLVMGPWNYPLQLALSPAIAAIAAGNTAVIKPSESTPATAELLRVLVGDAADPGHLTVVCGDADVAAGLLEQDFDFFFFTGGEKVGRIVAEAAAKKMVPSVLELGGKCPALLDQGIDLAITAQRLAVTKFFNAGQTCIAPDFVALPEPMLDAFRAKFAEEVRSCYSGGDPEIARCVHQAQFDRVKSLIPADAERVGEDDEASLHLAPSWAVVDWDHPSMKEEIFGPFLPIVTYQSRDELVEKLNGMPSPLALYLFTKDDAFSKCLTDSVRSGSVGINDVMKQATNLDLPFGGVGASGYGRYRGKAGFDAFSYERAVTKRYFFRDLFMVKPPFGDTLERLRRWVK